MHLKDDKLLEFYPWKSGLDLLNIVLIGISNDLPEHDEKYELHRLLSTLLSMELTVDEKLEIMDNTLAEVIMTMHEKGYDSAQIAEIAKRRLKKRRLQMQEKIGLTLEKTKAYLKRYRKQLV